MSGTCVVGAGPSGIAAAAALARRGLEFTWLEREEQVGGNWVYESRGSPMYASVRTNSSRRHTEFSDFPLPKACGHFPTHRDIAAYLDAYLDHAGLRPRIRLGAEVIQIRREDGRWAVSTGDGDTVRYDHVVLATGHHSEPRTPDVPGRFAGTIRHASEYRVPEPFAGRHVVVVGFGSTAIEVAVELAGTAEQVFLSFRRTLHVLPRFVAGIPFDHIETKRSTQLVPWPVRRLTAAAILRFLAPRPQDVGLPAPDHRLLEGLPSVGPQVFDRIRDGQVLPRPAIARFDGSEVVYEDGARDRADDIIFATGYRLSFPFLDGQLPSLNGDRVRLYRRIVHPRLPGLFFVGLLDAIGGLTPVIEEQGEWVADVVSGRLALPEPDELAAALERDEERIRRRFGGSEPLDTLVCDRFRYIVLLERDRRRARRRSRLRA